MPDTPDLGAPTSYLTLQRGVDVYDAAGAHVGKVDHVLADASIDIFDGIVVDTRSGSGGHRFADSEQVEELFERGVVLNVAADALHDPEPGPAALDVDPGEEESGLSARLRRAWDWISGNY
ncbi:DUF2171 domain-containing protein [Conexibacter sp. CPCC 206217]|uniref:DUF2171 domain-containing protein n=1 Tax=Conexibacter sp. CPCC 206217 TaxID=3064574 RepID=UPI00272490D3|nr:DUF2171 domain-containing protein [Conexibacter sp. CPCC 206217]MDO8211283.1 DUF2171 domain-containing protein [Conexibacter sp. CPCC 206217]